MVEYASNRLPVDEFRGREVIEWAEEPYVLQDLIKEVSDTYDRIILDLSPGLGRLERTAPSAACSSTSM